MIAEQEKTTTELILEEFKNCRGTKQDFIKHIAEKFNKNRQGVRNNWFYGMQVFPADLQEQILAEAKLYNNGNPNSK